MVGEVPELQGIAGRYYAKAAGESEAVALAIDEAYLPRFAGDAIATSKLGQVLAIAERLDTLAGGFIAKLQPTGNKDPFALRRNGLGLARTLLEGGHELSLSALIHHALSLQPGADMSEGIDLTGIATNFVYDRLRSYFNDKGLNDQLFEAVNSVPHDSLPDFAKRLAAIAEFAKLPEAAALAAANKRIGNILKKSGSEAGASVSEALLQEKAEKDLWHAVQTVAKNNAAKLAARDYVAVLQALAELRAPVDAFFEGVMVNAEDAAVRGNRLALLRNLAAQFNAVGDISVLA
jgi:glycyl-tRNA synthetase beta chain